ncbi:hypothetical protein QBC37DRAFT_378756 [Rhypophila decipiens]|uniref:Uncharacterized protein n=1 Tax=Rhypophila decipiens TaxID=261697 RepID=A0AAN7B3M6_9PEZI|nr:hypothetical protein QBC37DRAFT_378756 [Rhypophila decipiens]
MYARREVVADEVVQEAGHQHHQHEGEHQHSEHHRVEGQHHHPEGEQHRHDEHHGDHTEHHKHDENHAHHSHHSSSGIPSSESGIKRSTSSGGGLGKESGEHLIEGRSPRIISDESEESGIPPLAS